MIEREWLQQEVGGPGFHRFHRRFDAAERRHHHHRDLGAKSPNSLRLAPEQIAAAKHIAVAKSVGYQTQLRMWIAEGIRREAKRA